MPKKPPSSSTFSLIPAIKVRMEAAGLYPAKLAREAEMGESGLCQFLNGKRELRLETLQKVARVLGLELVLMLKSKR